MIVQVCEIYLIGRVVATSAYALVVASPFGTELLPALPSFLRGITAVAGAEHLPQLFGNFSLVAVPHAADDVAFEVGGATLKGGAGEYLAHDIVQTLQAVGAQEAYPFQPSFTQALKNLFPTRCALRWFVAYAQDLARLVFLYGQDDIKGLRLNAVPAVDFDMHAVDEHYGITAFQGTFQPFRHVLAQILHHARYARLAVMLAVYVVEHFGHLRLRQAFAVQAAGKAFALILLLAEDCQYAGVEVAVPVTGDTEVQGTTVTVCTARTEAVALVAAKAFFKGSRNLVGDLFLY